MDHFKKHLTMNPKKIAAIVFIVLGLCTVGGGVALQVISTQNFMGNGFNPIAYTSEQRGAKICYGVGSGAALAGIVAFFLS